MRFSVDTRKEIKRLLGRLRDFVEDSDVPRDEVDRRLGYAKGYLSQLLAGTIDLKYWHLIGILNAIGCRPQKFFDDVYPLPRPRLQAPPSRALRQALAIDKDVVGVYGLAVEATHELRQRLARCEATLLEVLSRQT